MINVVRGRRMISHSPWKMPEPIAWVANIVRLQILRHQWLDSKTDVLQVSLVYIILTTVLFLFPPDLPVTASNMSTFLPSFLCQGTSSNLAPLLDYCVAALGIVFIISLLQWIIDGRKNFTGPRHGLEELTNGVTVGQPAAEQQGFGEDIGEKTAESGSL